MFMNDIITPKITLIIWEHCTMYETKVQCCVHMFYRYRKWNIGDDLNVIVRCEHDGVISGSNGETQFLNIKTLNEWDTKVCSLTSWASSLLHRPIFKCRIF